MKNEQDIFKLFNEIDELIDSVNSENNKEDNVIEKEKINNIPEMPRFYIEENNIKTIDNKINEFYNFNNSEEFLKETIKNIEDNSNLNEVYSDYNKEEKLKESSQIIEEKHNKKTKKKKNKKWVVTFAVLDILAVICLFLMYGPITYFRSLWVTSAMTTRSHKYLAYIFFNEKQINDILANNTIIEVEGTTNKDEIIFEQEELEEEIVYSSPEEEQVLKRDEGNDLFKVIKIEGNGYKGHLLVVYDPSKIELVRSPNNRTGLTIEQFVERNGAVAGTNAGGFIYSKSTGYLPLGAMIHDGVVISEGVTAWGGGIIGFTEDNILVLTKATAQEAVEMGVRDAVSFGPFLIINGVPSEFKGNGGYGIAPRTAIGQRKDGIVLMLVIDGRRPGHSLGIGMEELTSILLKYGAYNASNLDGGGSSSIVVNGETLSIAGGSGYTGERYLSNAWVIMP